MGIDNSIARGVYRTLAETYRTDGRFYFEMLIRNTRTTKYFCDMVIQFQDPPGHKSEDLLVGVEVKDWKDPVPKGVVLDELDGYRHSFDYFYFAANEFGPSALDLDVPEVGLIDIIDDFEVIEFARSMPTFAWDRAATIEAIDRNWRRNHDRLSQQYPSLVERGDAAEQGDHRLSSFGAEGDS